MRVFGFYFYDPVLYWDTLNGEMGEYLPIIWLKQPDRTIWYIIYPGSQYTSQKLLVTTFSQRHKIYPLNIWYISTNILVHTHVKMYLRRLYLKQN